MVSKSLNVFNSTKGFTLIELVVVIVILGLLAAVAVPKFIDMRVDARRASIASLYGSVQSASVLTRAQVLVQGVSSVGLGSIVVSGDNVGLVNGYPSAVGILSVLDLQGFAASTVGATTAFTIVGYSGSNCQVEYTEADPGDSPSIVMVNSGCD